MWRAASVMLSVRRADTEQLEAVADAAGAYSLSEVVTERLSAVASLPLSLSTPAALKARWPYGSAEWRLLSRQWTAIRRVAAGVRRSVVSSPSPKVTAARWGAVGTCLPGPTVDPPPSPRCRQIIGAVSGESNVLLAAGVLALDALTAAGFIVYSLSSKMALLALAAGVAGYASCRKA